MKVLDEPKRISIRTRMAGVIGDEDAESLVSALPSEGDRIVTEDFLKAELAEQTVRLEEKFVTRDFLKAELNEQTVRLEEKFVTRELLKGELAEQTVRLEEKFVTRDFLKGELSEGFYKFGLQMEDKFSTKEFLEAEVGTLRTEVAERLERQTSQMYRAILLAFPIGAGISGALAAVIGKVAGAG